MVLVMGAAIVHEGRVLAARRTFPEAVAGRWEFPGGKVEPGEEPEQAVVREVAEELGCGIEVTGRLPGEVPIREDYTLRVAVAALTDGEPVPRLDEHDAVRWLGPEELHEVAWLDPDIPFLQELRRVLVSARDETAGGGVPMRLRAVFYEEDDARAVAARLNRDGFEAVVERERLAGEDDDEDHSWAVVTDAPERVVDVLVEQYDGWLDHGSAEGNAERIGVPPPAAFPDVPRRVEGRFVKD